MTSPRLGGESFGRLAMDVLGPTNDEEAERAASAETWILTGGAWKKRKEAAIAAGAAVEGGPQEKRTSSSAPNSPFRSRVLSKLQPPPSSSRNQNTLQRPSSRGRAPSIESSLVSSSDAVSTTSRTSSRSRSSKVSEAGGVNPITRRPSLTSRQDSFTGSYVSRNTESFAIADPPFLRSSSALSGVSKGSTVDTSRRSIRTSQTEPPRPTSSSNNTVGGISTMTFSSIPAVVVEEKKRKQKKSSKPANAWLQEKDDFFSATRHSDSVPRPARASVQSEFETASRSTSVISREGSFRSTSSSLKQNEESSRPGSTSTRTPNTSPGKEDFRWTNISPKQVRPKEPMSSWKDEKKEPDLPVERVVPNPPLPDEIPISVRNKHLRKNRARSITPRARNAQSAAENGQKRHLSPLQKKARERTPERKNEQRKVRAPSPDASVTILSAKELLAQQQHQSGNAEESSALGLPLSHVTAIRQCFGFDCDIYKDILRVGRTATERQLRIAYFRRGRNILAEHQHLAQNSSLEQAAMLKGLSADTKEKFEAVSLAYEIINRPAWRELYDQHGWDAPLADYPVRRPDNIPSLEETRASRQERGRAVEPRSRSTTPILRPAVDADERRSRSAGRGIRWSEQVEELVFRQEPEELESRKLRSPPPPEMQVLKPPVFEESWMELGLDRNGGGSFMANFLSEIDQSLDGLEASLDGLMGRSFEDWSISSKGSATKKQIPAIEKPLQPKTGRVDRESTQSPASLESGGPSSWEATTIESDTVPSNLTDQDQGPTSLLARNAPSPDVWDGGASMTSTLPSTINSLDESDEMTVKQLFTALTKTTDDRKKGESPSSEKRKSDEGSDDRSSPSDVRKVPTEAEEVARAFSEYGKQYVEVQPKARRSGEYFDPFNDSASTININDSDFGKVMPTKKLSPPRLPVVEDVTSACSTPTRSPKRRTQPERRPRTEIAQSTPRSQHLFSKGVPEFEETAPLKTEIVETPLFPRAESEFSSLTGNTRSTFNSVKTDHVLIASNNGHFCAPIRDKVSIQPNEAVVPRSPSKEERPPSHNPCSSDFLSHLFCYTNAISTDLSSFGHEFSSKLSATQAMIVESLTFSDEQMKSVASAMEMPGVERSNTI